MCEKTYEILPREIFKEAFIGKLNVDNIPNMIVVTELLLSSLKQIKEIFDIEDFKMKSKQ